MAKITYEDKVALLENADIPDINKITDDDMNEIKQVVNENDDKFLTNGLNVSNEVDEDYRVNFLHSKNLLFKLPTTNTQNGITFTNNGDGTFNVSGTASAQAFFYFYATYNELGLSNGKTYTLSSNKAFPTGLYFQFEDYQGESTWKSSLLQIDNTQQTNTSSITLAGDRIRVGVRISNGATVNISNVGIILNSGSQIDYEPYITPSINVDNEEIYSKEDVLYLGNDNTITQINLKNNIKDYSYIEIYYRNSWLFTSIKITPNATSIPLTIVYGSSTNGITIHSSVWEVISNGTGLRLVDGRDRDTFISTSPSYNTTRQVYITKVVGYK